MIARNSRTFRSDPIDHSRYVRRCRTPSELCQPYQAKQWNSCNGMARYILLMGMIVLVAIQSRDPPQYDEHLRFPPKVALKFSKYRYMCLCIQV
jgi:hypothetical protein